MRAAFWAVSSILLVVGTYFLYLGLPTKFAVFTFVASLFFAYAAELQQRTRLERFAARDSSAGALKNDPMSPLGSLIVFRYGFPSKLLGMNIAIDGRVFVQLKSPRFTRVDLPEGVYELSAAFCSYLANRRSPRKIEARILAEQTTIVGIAVGLPERWRWWRIGSKDNWRDQIYMTIAPSPARSDAMRYLAKIRMVVPDQEAAQK